MKNNIAILLARLDSKRLPKKHFEKIGNEALIDICYNGLKKGKNYKIVLATSDREIDRPLVDWAKENNVDVYCGDAHNLKERIKGCIQTFGADFFARVNADSPFINSELIDEGFACLNSSDYDMYTNILPRSFPYGYSVEVFNAQAFLKTINDN